MDKKGLDGKVMCDVEECSKVFSNKQNARRHFRTAHADLSWGCVLCNMKFTRRDVWKEHFRTCGEDVDIHRYSVVDFMKELEGLDTTGSVGQLVSPDNKEIDSIIEYLQTIPTSTAEAQNRHILTACAIPSTKRTLSFILGCLCYYPVLAFPPCTPRNVQKPSLRWLLRLDVCQKLHNILSFRRVGSARVHGIFITVAKVLMWVASTKRVSHHHSPIAYNRLQSWGYVFQVKSSAGKKRKTERSIARDEAPEIDHSDIRKLRSELVSHLDTATVSIAAGDYYKKTDITKATSFRFMCYLFTLTLLLLPTPRGQVMRLVDIGKHFFIKNGLYNISLSGRFLKNKKPYIGVIPKFLSKYYKVYLSHYRPVLIGKYGKCKSLWISSSGTTRKSMTHLTKFATRECLGYPINPHFFRHIVISMFAESGASDRDMEDLAILMNHSREEQRNTYRRYSRERIAKRLQPKVDSLSSKRMRFG